jgi:DNA-binding NtrC family response regulator
VADDEAIMRESVAAWLREDGHLVEAVPSGDAAVQRARDEAFDLYILDLKMPPGIDGIEAMRLIRALRPDPAVIIITAFATVDTAIDAMKEGAQEYVVKPCNPQELSLHVERILRVRRLERENALLRQTLERRWRFHDLVSKSARMHEIFALVRDVAALRSTVLVQGESGTGKEVLARALHAESERAGGPFVAVSCAALAETLLESELFGHERGAFTGAVQQKRGKFELAHGGTLFLDEIGDVAPKLQVDLLRVLQERAFTRVGGTQEVRVDVRVVAASNQDLAQAVREGRFRQDLFYRLNVVAIRIPPLRERMEDVPLLVAHFVQRIAAEIGKPVTGVSEDALARLMEHDWPGNVRELENAVERALVTCHGPTLTAADLDFLRRHGTADTWEPPAGLALRELEARAIEATLRRTGGNVKLAAEQLGIDRSTLYDKLKRYDIERPGS